MNNRTTDTDESVSPVRLAEHKAFSRAFQPLFNEGMALVDETATYLDGEGRQSARELPKSIATLYAAESMRLTTRLMQVASWLLLQRAVNEGDMSRSQVEAEKRKVRLDSHVASRETENYGALPEAFRDLAERAKLLERRIALLDRELYGNDMVRTEREQANPVGEQINLLKTAFDR
ncbi:regulator of CtrA degradation [Fulvimarina manganoxydans]|uniref:Regulator of CtrA degradation n=1 Tax=Fulvimarina manganoxydans TaxID=937218 RepID=A0A1W1YMN5_9HYPH|nr:DUF1465 family protein [Fulvimarina manganoxydans]MEE2950565.1 DUF1465 family protein [Pseudomonadota bacterium]SMC37465.1 regulator of CtrA degradation [Fulvimarina manganoxydans]